jgi:hypothetical protein
MTEKLVSIACLSGFLTDGLLQIFTKFSNVLGLKAYFHDQGSLQSLFIAAGMSGIFYIVYLYLLKLPVVWPYLALYGILIDLVFRRSALFPGLHNYYQKVNYVSSGFFAATSMVLPLFIAKHIHIGRF